MTNYDLAKLNDKEFESLCVDLVAKTEKVRVERFKPGSDQGIDGRFFSSDGNQVIIQCKHWLKSGYNKLINYLRKSEADKVKKLQPTRYLFFTSVSLSPKNKQTIKRIFSPFIKSESDIFGNEDLQDLIYQYREIEEKHYKLWLSSSHTLQSILNAAVIGRSNFKLEEIRNFSPKYVVTDNHEKAKEKADKLGAIIIIGEPGIGKTTLANHICLDYIANGFQFCFLENDIAEAESVYKEKEKQIFYFDDFLGRNYLVALGRKEDSHVVNFIKRVSQDKTKRFVLTSRTTVLNQGKRLSDLFHQENLEQNEYSLDIKYLSNYDKAKILYNHIWFGDLSEEYIEEIYKNKRYHFIIRHHNYNPRLVSFITDSFKVSCTDPPHYWEYITSTLSNPVDIWDHVFDNQLDEESKALVSLIVFNGKAIEEDHLKESFIHLLTLTGAKTKLYGPYDFIKSAKLAVGALINKEVDPTTNKLRYDVFNPSVTDFLLSRYSEDKARLCKIFLALATPASISNVRGLYDNNIISTGTMKTIINELSFDCFNDNVCTKFMNYQLRLLYLFKEHFEWNEKFTRMIKIWAQNIKETEINDGLIWPYVKNMLWLLDNKKININDVNWNMYLDSIVREGLSHDDYVIESELIAYLGYDYPKKYNDIIRKYAVEYWQDMIAEEVSESGILDGFVYETDADDAEQTLYDWTTSKLSEYNFEIDDSTVVNIVGYCDMWDFIYANQERQGHEYYADEARNIRDDSGYGETDQIDDLFDRS